jgi:hypothetical protein
MFARELDVHQTKYRMKLTAELQALVPPGQTRHLSGNPIVTNKSACIRARVPSTRCHELQHIHIPGKLFYLDLDFVPVRRLPQTLKAS